MTVVVECRRPCQYAKALQELDDLKQSSCSVVLRMFRCVKVPIAYEGAGWIVQSHEVMSLPGPPKVSLPCNLRLPQEFQYARAAPGSSFLFFMLLVYKLQKRWGVRHKMPLQVCMMTYCFASAKDPYGLQLIHTTLVESVHFGYKTQCVAIQVPRNGQIGIVWTPGYVVQHVLEDTAAAQAGIVVDDRLVKVNHIVVFAATENVNQAHALLENATGTLFLTLRRAY